MLQGAHLPGRKPSASLPGNINFSKFNIDNELESLRRQLNNLRDDIPRKNAQDAVPAGVGKQATPASPKQDDRNLAHEEFSPPGSTVEVDLVDEKPTQPVVPFNPAVMKSLKRWKISFSGKIAETPENFIWIWNNARRVWVSKHEKY